MPKGNSGINKHNGGKTASKQTAPVDMVRGVPQSEIDKLRGTRDHQAAGSISWQTIQDDYKRVGIPITDKEAQDIAQAIKDFSFLHDTDIRKAMNKYNQGLSLRPSEQKYLAQGLAIQEYCKVAPLLPSSQHPVIYRGVKFSTKTPDYVKGLLALKAGDKWDVDKLVTSFSTSKTVAQDFSYLNGKKGIVIHMPTTGMKNFTSIMGISHFPGENEVLFNDYAWKVGKVVDNLGTGGYYEIHLVHQ